MKISKRQLEVAEHISLGFSDKEIAKKLEISWRTVGDHVSALLKVFGFNNRTEIAVYIAKNGLKDILVKQADQKKLLAKVKRWTEEEKKILRNKYRARKCHWEELLSLLPDRSKKTIYAMAFKMGLTGKNYLE